jgi:hypothetical protein
MMFVAVVVVVVVVGLMSAMTSGQPIPSCYSDSYFLIASRNHTEIETGRRYEFEAIREWGIERTARGNPDGQRRKRTECTLSDALSSVQIHIETDSWIFNPTAQFCIFARMPVAPTNHTWMRDADYVGQLNYNNVPVYAWIKQDHYWYETVDGQRPFAFDFPLDQTGAREGQEDFARYNTVEASSILSEFDVPSYCDNAAPAEYQDWVDLAKQMRSDAVSRRQQEQLELLKCFFPSLQDPIDA